MSETEDNRLIEAIGKILEQATVSEALAKKTDKELGELVLTYVWADMNVFGPHAALIEAIYDRLVGTVCRRPSGHPKPVCPKCEIAMFPKRSGATVVQMAFEPPEPYALWYADLWECRECHNQVLVGFGDNPFSEHYKLGFEGDLKFAMEALGTETFREYEPGKKPDK